MRLKLQPQRQSQDYAAICERMNKLGPLKLNFVQSMIQSLLIELTLVEHYTHRILLVILELKLSSLATILADNISAGACVIKTGITTATQIKRRVVKV